MNISPTDIDPDLADDIEIETRTGPLVQELVEALQADLDEAIVHLERGLKIIEALVGDTKGVNGLSSFLKAQSVQLEKMIGDTREESEAVARKMFGVPRPRIVEHIDQEKVEELREAVEEMREAV